MKLREKLCNDYIRLPPKMRTFLEEACATSYLAGFEVAKERSSKVVELAFLKYSGMDLSRALRLLQGELETLGEEEVL